VLTDGCVTGVRTDAGDVEAEVVVNCAGSGPRQVGALAGVNVPLYSAEHFYVVTETIDGVHLICRSCATPTATPTSRRRSAAW
jgi:4-methylaminobutanoate oxidase (formaldehyde-forming)